jgi:excisionase family DNA binding protein
MDQKETLIEHLRNRRTALKVKEFADLLSVSPRAIYERVKSNRIPYFKIGCMVRLDGRRLAEWLEQKEVLPLSMRPQQEVWHSPTSQKARSKTSRKSHD